VLAYWGFESLHLRHMYLNKLTYFVYFRLDPRIDPQSSDLSELFFRGIANRKLALGGLLRATSKPGPKLQPSPPHGRAAAAPARGLWLAATSRRTLADYPGFGTTSTAASAFAATCRAIRLIP
jgi:hypothetical protein